jgi:Rhomboid-like protein
VPTSEVEPRETTTSAARIVGAVARLAPTWRQAPFTVGYLVLVGIGSLQLALLDRADRLAILHASSTDVVNLRRHPLFVLFASGLWVQGLWRYLIVIVVLGVAGGYLERLVGTTVTVGVFVSGHVLSTVLTEGAVAIGARIDLLPDSALSRLDIGVSYGLVAVLAAAAGLLPVRYRRRAVALGWLALIAALLVERDMTAWGHLTAFALGLAWWPVLRSRRRWL